MIIYTAIYGGKDILRPALAGVDPSVAAELKKEIRFVCYSDVPMEAEGWDVIVSNRPEKTPVMRAKWFKLHSHELFPDEVSMWMDGNYILKSDPRKYFEMTNEDAPLTICEHHRGCVYDEFKALLSFSKRRPLSDAFIDACAMQRKYMEVIGVPKGTRMFHGGACLIRHPSIASFNYLWWLHINRFSYRDQISLSYLVWNSGLSVNVIDLECYPTLKAGKHKRNKLPLPL